MDEVGLLYVDAVDESLLEIDYVECVDEGVIDIVDVECVDGWLIYIEDVECMQVGDVDCVRILGQDVKGEGEDEEYELEG